MRENLDVEAALVAYLSERLGTPAFGEAPDPRPEEFLTVERDGGATEAWRDLPAVAVQCWAGSKHRAGALASRAAAALLAFEREPRVMRVEVTGSYPFPDPDSRQHRYQVTASIVTA